MVFPPVFTAEAFFYGLKAAAGPKWAHLLWGSLSIITDYFDFSKYYCTFFQHF
jgi:hypothetical protein